MVEIIPAILVNDKSEFEKLISTSKDVVERVQIDVIDGLFAKNKTLPPEELTGVDYGELKRDFHLMVKDPIGWIDRCREVGADRIIGQIEMMDDQEEFVQTLIDLEIPPGLAIDIDTPVSDLDEEVLKKTDVVLVMSVKAGFGGQEFDKSIFEKIDELVKKRDELGAMYSICDDGGITLHLIDNVHFVGADEVSIGRRIFKKNLKENIQKYQKAAHKVKK